MARTISYVLGAVMVIMGVLGFAMHGSVLGIFMADSALAALWLIAGVVTLIVAVWLPAHAMLWAKAMGIVFAVIAVLGFVVNGPVFDYFDNTMADNVLHLVIAAIFLAAGFMPMGSSMPQQARMTSEATM
jgi:hypothetical protein